MIPNPAAAAAAAAAVEEELREQQRRLLLGLLGASSSSWRPTSFAPLWPPHNASPGAASGASDVVEDPGSGSAAVGAVGAGEEASGGAGAGRGASGPPSSPSSSSSSASPPPPPPPGQLSPWDVALCVTGTAAAGENALALALLCCWGAPPAGGPRWPPGLLLVASLALADLLSGLGLMVHFAVGHLLRPPSQAATLGAAGLLLTAFSASACSLLALTADRYLSLAQALTYPASGGRAGPAVALLLLWLLCAGLGLLPWLGWHCLRGPSGACSVLRPVPREEAFLLAAAFLLLLLLLLLLDVRICRIARRHAQQIAVQQRQRGAPSPAPRRGGLAALALSVGAFALGWMPLALYALVGHAGDPPAYASALALPAAAHALLNPLLYAFRHPDVQKTLRLACCGCGCPPRLAPRPGPAAAASDV